MSSFACLDADLNFVFFVFLICFFFFFLSLISGWIGGSLGSAGEGIMEPIAVTIKFSRRGLGF